MLGLFRITYSGDLSPTSLRLRPSGREAGLEEREGVTKRSTPVAPGDLSSMSPTWEIAGLKLFGCSKAARARARAGEGDHNTGLSYCDDKVGTSVREAIMTLAQKKLVLLARSQNLRDTWVREVSNRIQLTPSLSQLSPSRHHHYSPLPSPSACPSTAACH